MRMVDIGGKEITEREAQVTGAISLKPKVIAAIKKKRVPKGDVLQAAKVAGILAAKKTPFLIPLCHPIPIEYVEIDFLTQKSRIKIVTTVRGKARTGFEMEAFTATAVAALTIYDMCKPIDKDMVISDIRLLKKTGGKSGVYIRNSKIKIQSFDYAQD